MVKVIFQCGGCDAKAEAHVSRQFVSVSGRSYGFGSYVEQKVSDVAPKGWIAFDPYTSCTYCPECWASIEKESA